MVVHPNLRRFLRHHSDDLALARDLRRSIACGSLERLHSAWNRGLGDRLLNDVRNLAPLSTPRLAARLITAVGTLRDLAEAPEGCDVREVGIRLEEYLLWKERELLPMLEVVATPPELDRLGKVRSMTARKNSG